MDANDRSIVGFVMLAHATVHTYELAIPILLTVWLVEFSTTTAVLGAVVSLGYGLFGLGALPGGALADRYGSRTLIVASLSGMGASFALLSLAPSVAGIALALCLWGVAASAYHPAGLALISNGVREQGRGFGYHGAAGNVGIALGPLATALLLLAFDWRTVAFLLVVPALVGVAAGLVVSFDERAAVSGARTDGGLSLSRVLADTRTLLTVGFATVLLVVTLNGLYYRGLLTFLPGVLGDLLAAPLAGIEPVDPDSLASDEFDPARYVYAGLLLVGVFGQYAGGRLVDRIRPEVGLAGVLFALAAASLAFVLFSIQPLGQALVASYAAPDVRGLTFGYSYLAIFGVGALGAAIAGTLLTYGSARVLFVFLGGLVATSGGLCAWLARRDHS
ncbi:MAG: MFS transporter [Halalkalicoccus sp.]